MLILENGKMPAQANSFSSVEFADDWNTARNSELWPLDPDPETIAKKEAALIKATDYLNGLNWNGRKAAPGRIMAWPRIQAHDQDGYNIDPETVPEAVMAACSYLAGLVYGGAELQPMLERGGRIQSKAIGKLKKTYFQDANNRDVFSGLYDLLAGLVDFGPGPDGVFTVPIAIA